MSIVLNLKLDGEEWDFYDDYPDLFDRGDQEIFVALALEHRGEQLDHGGASDRGLLVEPGTVGGDPHVDIAAKRRIPQLHRRRRPAAVAGQRCRDPFQSANLRANL